MASLIIAGITLRTIKDSWVRKPSIYQGARVRARAGNLISTETAEKRVFECTIDLYDATEEAALRAACLRGVAVTIDGDLPESSFSGVVDIGDSQTLLVQVLGVDTLLRPATLHIEEA